MNKRIYITTSIPYVNANLHIGHGLEFVEADFFARFNRMLKREVFFSTGSDENSLKVAKKAQELGVETKSFTDKQVEEILKLLKLLNIKFDHFQRTSEENHKKATEKIYELIKRDIYKKRYKGLYCLGCEAFLKKSELMDGLCPIHKTKPEEIEEENYFFRLTKYKDKLLEIYKNKTIKIIPERRTSEVLSWLKDLEDASISRSKERAYGWGIEVPSDKSQVFYVWFDALVNYLSGLGFPEKTKLFSDFWLSEKAEKIHFIGKDILRFHAVLWPAMLLSAGLPLPSKIFVHGFLLNKGEKMSKSRGNIVSPAEVSRDFSPETIRYFLLREFSPTEDGDFSLERLKTRYNDDLAKGLGNLASRIISLFLKDGDYIEINGNELQEKLVSFKEKFISFTENFRFNESISALWSFISEVDRYINKKEPWRLEKGSKARKDAFSTLWLSLSEISFWLQPAMPETAKKISSALGIGETEKKGGKKRFKIQAIERLFPRKEP